jgi:hypothetical protein
MNISELTGEALDLAVAQCEGHDVDDPTWWADFGDESCYSTDWAQGGPIIEREMIELIPQTPALWDAMYRGQHIPNDGPTPLIAAMRCYVASKLGATL